MNKEFFKNISLESILLCFDQNNRLSTKINDYFKDNIKLVFHALRAFILITKDDKFYKIEIIDDYVSLVLNSDNKELEEQRNNEISSLFESTFVEKLSGKGIIDIVNGWSHVMVRTYDQKVYCFGNNSYGQLGNGIEEDRDFEPELNQYLSDKNIVEMKCGAYHSLALTASGEVYAWGWNDGGLIGNGSHENQLFPIILDGFDGEVVKSISCGSFHSMALIESGRVFSWGWNESGQLGIGNKLDSYTPKLIEIDVEIEKISCGFSHSLLLSRDGDIYVFGDNNLGQLGIEDEGKQLSPMIRNDWNKFKDIASLFSTSAAISKENKTYVWGKCFEEVLKEPKETSFESMDQIFLYYLNRTLKPYPESCLFKDCFVRNRKYDTFFDEIEELGRGSFGTVYKSRFKAAMKLYAVKKIVFEINEENKLLKESKISSLITKFDDNFVVRIYSAWLENNFKITNNEKIYDKSLTLYIQMQLCDKTLEDIINVFENDPSLKNDDMLTPLGYYIAGQIFIEILEAVNHLHEHKPPLIHRDLKPGNILLNRKSNDRFVKIGDFGLATLHEMIGQSHTGSNVQAPKYIAPEVETKEYTTKADIYSLGAILIDIFEIFDIYEDSVDEKITGILRSKYENLIKLRNKMLSDCPNERPTCKQVLNEKHFWALSEAEEKQIENFNEQNIYLKVPEESYGTENNEKYHTIMRTKFLTSEVEHIFMSFFRNCECLSRKVENIESLIILIENILTFSKMVENPENAFSFMNFVGCLRAITEVSEFLSPFFDSTFRISAIREDFENLSKLNDDKCEVIEDSQTLENFFNSTKTFSELLQNNEKYLWLLTNIHNICWILNETLNSEQIHKIIQKTKCFSYFIGDNKKFFQIVNEAKNLSQLIGVDETLLQLNENENIIWKFDVKIFSRFIKDTEILCRLTENPEKLSRHEENARKIVQLIQNPCSLSRLIENAESVYQFFSQPKYLMKVIKYSLYFIPKTINSAQNYISNAN